jgi:hypothetical protein
MSVKPNSESGRLRSSPLGGWGLGMVLTHDPLRALASPTAEMRT